MNTVPPTRSVAEAGIDSMPVEVAIVDADGTIVLVNETWRRFGDENHGTHPEYWVGENYFDVCECADDPHAVKTVDGLKAIVAGERDRFRLEYPCHSPEKQRWYTVDAVGFTHEGEQYLFLCHFDITERKLAELRADARADQLETLIGVLTHDIRNPLQVIDGYADMLAAELGDNEQIESIRRSVERITEITEATLAFSRSGALSSVEPIDLRALATDAWANVTTADATLTITDSTTIHGDRRLLLQLCENLFRNAVEHAGSDCRVTVGALPTGFYVADDGPGIPLDVRELALEANFSTQGTGGLGLAIVHAVTRAHGGTLEITDADDGGTRFELTGFEMAP